MMIRSRNFKLCEIQLGKKFIDIAGRRFGYLVAIAATGTKDKHHQCLWRCQCDCGKTTIRPTACLLSGNTKSCGCQKYGKSATHGHHPITGKSRTYVSWLAMKVRCDKPSYPQYRDYGGRGITYDPRWARFDNFLADMGEATPGMSLDRKDNDGPYTRNNCRWATRLEQAQNKRNTIEVDHNGEKISLRRYCDIHNLPYDLIKTRLRRLGWDLQKAIATPRLTSTSPPTARRKTVAVWKSMKARCNNPKRPEYRNYGGRGITYDPRWETFKSFLVDMGEAPPGKSLERKNNDGPYTKDNCCWATWLEQCANKRNTIKIEHDGKLISLRQWCLTHDFPYDLARTRVRLGWPVHLAISTPKLTGGFDKNRPALGY